MIGDIIKKEEITDIDIIENLPRSYKELVFRRKDCNKDLGYVELVLTLTPVKIYEPKNQTSWNKKVLRMDPTDRNKVVNTMENIKLDKIEKFDKIKQFYTDKLDWKITCTEIGGVYGFYYNEQIFNAKKVASEYFNNYYCTSNKNLYRELVWEDDKPFYIYREWCKGKKPKKEGKRAKKRKEKILQQLDTIKKLNTVPTFIDDDIL